MNVIELKDIVKSYAMGDTTVYALNHLTVSFEKGKFTSIVGPSGSGKSTLMNVLGCLDRPTSGEYILEGKNIARYTDDELAHTRNARIGFVFQSFNLLSRLSAGRQCGSSPDLCWGRSQGEDRAGREGPY